MRSISELISDVVKQMEQSEEGLRNLCFGINDFDFEKELENNCDFGGITKIRRTYAGAFVSYEVFMDARTFFDLCNTDIDEKQDCTIIINSITDEDRNNWFEINSYKHFTLAIQENVRLQCKVRHLSLSGDNIYKTMGSKSNIKCDSCFILFKSIEQGLCYKLTAFYLFVLGYLGNNFVVDNDTLIYAIAFYEEDMKYLIQEVGYHFDLLNELKEKMDVVFNGKRMQITFILNYECTNNQILLAFDDLKCRSESYYESFSVEVK